MIKYVFKEAPVILRNAQKANPQKIGETLAELTEQAKGHLTPEAVVNAARNTRSPLHPHFEWDDALAAQKHRLDQARSLIRIVRIEDEKTKETTPAYVSISDHGTSYRTVQEVVSSADLQLLVLRQAERDLHAFEKRYHMLADICETVKQARENIERKRSKLETRAAA